MSRLRNRLVLLFIGVTAVPLGLTLYVAHSLERRLAGSAAAEMDELSKSLESTARQYYVRERETLRAQAAGGRIQPERFPASEIRLWPAGLAAFWESGEAERMLLAGENSSTLWWLRRGQDEVLRFERDLGELQLDSIRARIAHARHTLELTQARGARGGFLHALMALAALPWLAALAVLIFSTHREMCIRDRPRIEPGETQTQPRRLRASHREVSAG